MCYKHVLQQALWTINVPLRVQDLLQCYVFHLQEVDEDKDGHISFREFLLIFRKFNAGELDEDSGLGLLAKQCEINVDEVGVVGAKDFFEAQVPKTSFASYCRLVP